MSRRSDHGKPTVGMKLFSLNIGNRERNCEQKLTPVTVTAVGRKYFTCTRDDWRIETRYHLSDWSEKTEYCANSCLYRTEQEYLDVKEKIAIADKLSPIFRYAESAAKMPLSVLREINVIIDKWEKEGENNDC